MMEASDVKKRATLSIFCGKNSLLRAAADMVLVTSSILHSHSTDIKSDIRAGEVKIS